MSVIRDIRLTRTGTILGEIAAVGAFILYLPLVCEVKLWIKVSSQRLHSFERTLLHAT